MGSSVAASAIASTALNSIWLSSVVTKANRRKGRDSTRMRPTVASA